MSPGAHLRVIAAAVTSVGVAMCVLIIQALRELPLEQLHPIALLALGVCASGLLATAITVAAAALAHSPLVASRNKSARSYRSM
jgi:hypothetical protein